MIVLFFVDQLLKILRFRRWNILQAMLALIRKAVKEPPAFIEPSIEVLNLSYFPALVRVSQQWFPFYIGIIGEILFGLSSLDNPQCNIVQFITE